MKLHSQGHATLRSQAEHHLPQGRHPGVVTVREGGKSPGLQAADATCRGSELRRGAGAQRRRVEVREHRP